MLIFFLSLQSIYSQMIVEVVIIDGQATTTCTDPVFPPPDTVWSVNVANGGWVNYPQKGACFNDPPMTQLLDTFTCPVDMPAGIDVCFRALEDDGAFCFVIPTCMEEICQNFPLPAPNTVDTHTLALPAGGASEGSVTFTISAIGNTAVNDFPCDAIHLGTLTSGDTLGDASSSIFSSQCATNTNEPNPFSMSGWWNGKGVWVSFTTSATPASFHTILVTNDPSGLGNDLDAQVAVYEAVGGDCNNLVFVTEEFQFGSTNFDEELFAACFKPNTTYYILVDGANSNSPSAEEGYFGLEVREVPGVQEAADLICDAEYLGVVPDGGSIASGFQANNCATAINDPTAVAFSNLNPVWFQFDPPATGHVIVDAFATLPFLQGGYDAIDLQLAIFTSLTDTCIDPVHVSSIHTTGSFDETLEVICLDTSLTYWLMVDGSNSNRRGVFEFTISDGGYMPPLNIIDTAICAGESITIAGSTYNTTGIYTNKVSLLNGCDSTIITNLTVWDSLSVIAAEVKPAPNGIATANVTGGNMPYTYQWSTGATTQTISNLPSETYCVTVTDVNGCTDTSCIFVTLIPPVVLSASADTLDCFGDMDGIINLQTMDGEPPYSYIWQSISGGALNGNGIINVFNGTATIPNLIAGTYSITITDNQDQHDTVEVTIIEPPELIVNLSSQDNVSCFGICDGLAALTVIGGTLPYAYQWPDGNTTPANSALCAGQHIVTITDANNCIANITIDITEPAEFIATAVSLKPVTCFGDSDGQAMAQSNGNAINYIWDNGEMGATATQLTGGDHFVVVTNQDGCTDTAFVIIESADEPLAAFVHLVKSVTCPDDPDGILIGDVTGGKGPGFTYQWSNGFVGQQAEGLVASSYTLTIVDQFGCTAEATYDLNAPDPLDAVLSVKDATCIGNEMDGEITVTSVSGGLPSYTYSTDGVNFITNNTFANLSPGEHAVYVQDSLGCIQSFSETVNLPGAVFLDLGPDIEIRLGESVQLQGFTNNTAVVPLWLPPDALSCTDCLNPVAMPTQNTVYTLTITDSVSGCSATDAVLIRVSSERELFLPNIFSPNGDGTNDYFTIFGGDDVNAILRMAIYDRWGNMVYEGANIPVNDPLYGWNGTYKGKPVPADVYVFMAEVAFVDGHVEMVKGDVTVVR